MMLNMKLYYAPSVCSLAVRIVINELAIQCEYESVDLKTKKTQSGIDFLKINPKGSVPVLQLNHGEFLTENAIILQYLSDKYHKAALLPPYDDIKRYRALEWLNFVGTDLHRYCAPLFWSRISPEVKENLFRPTLNNKLIFVERHLENNKFLLGDQFTLPDSYLFVILIWLAKLRFKMMDYPNLSRYFSTMKQRESVQLSLAEENLLSLIE